MEAQGRFLSERAYAAEKRIAFCTKRRFFALNFLIRIYILKKIKKTFEKTLDKLKSI